MTARLEQLASDQETVPWGRNRRTETADPSRHKNSLRDHIEKFMGVGAKAKCSSVCLAWLG